MADREQTRRDARLSAFDTAEEATRLRADREQTRRDEVEAFLNGTPRFWADMVPEVPRSPMDSWGTLSWARFARSLLAELEQAERERDEAVALADDQNAAASLAAFRLAKVPALVEAATNAYLRTTDETIKALGIALADYEQEPDVPS